MVKPERPLDSGPRASEPFDEPPPSINRAWRSYKERVATLAQRIVDAQRPLRVLNSIKWPNEVFVRFRDSGWREMPKFVPSLSLPKDAEPIHEPKTAEPIDDLGIPIETRRRQQEAARKIDPQRRERLEKAFRPPPNVPDDL